MTSKQGNKVLKCMVCDQEFKISCFSVISYNISMGKSMPQIQRRDQARQALSSPFSRKSEQHMNPWVSPFLVIGTKDSVVVVNPRILLGDLKVGVDNEEKTWYPDTSYKFKKNGTEVNGTFRCKRIAKVDI